jgi:hypothetical protein
VAAGNLKTAAVFSTRETWMATLLDRSLVVVAMAKINSQRLMVSKKLMVGIKSDLSFLLAGQPPRMAVLARQLSI